MTVSFENVGGQKKSWTAELADLSDRELIRSIRTHRALASREIDFIWESEDTEPSTRASIYVGTLRKVGTLQVTGGAKLWL